MYLEAKEKRAKQYCNSQSSSTSRSATSITEQSCSVTPTPSPSPVSWVSGMGIICMFHSAKNEVEVSQLPHT